MKDFNLRLLRPILFILLVVIGGVKTNAVQLQGSVNSSSANDWQGFEPMSVSRKLFKIHQPSPSELTIAQEEKTQAIQRQIDTDLGKIEHSVQNLDKLIDKKSENDSKLAKLNRRKNRRKLIARKARC